jgi:hypothetical protein
MAPGLRVFFNPAGTEDAEKRERKTPARTPALRVARCGGEQSAWYVPRRKRRIEIIGEDEWPERRSP